MGVEPGDIKALKSILASIPSIQIPKNRSETRRFLARRALQDAIKHASSPSIFRKYIAEATSKLNDNTLKEIALKYGAFQRKEPIEEPTFEGISLQKNRFKELTKKVQNTYPQLARKTRYAPEYHELHFLFAPDEITYYSSQYRQIIDLCNQILSANHDENVLRIKQEAEKCLKSLRPPKQKSPAIILSS